MRSSRPTWGTLLKTPTLLGGGDRRNGSGGAAALPRTFSDVVSAVLEPLGGKLLDLPPTLGLRELG